MDALQRSQRYTKALCHNGIGAAGPCVCREQTVYYAKVFKEDLGRGLEILSDILINSRLDERAVHRERDVIIREMEEVNKQQEEVRDCCL